VTLSSATSIEKSSLQERIEHASRRIAPTWPLDRSIAVNPLWGYISRPIEWADADLATLTGSRFLMPPSYYRKCWKDGVLSRYALEAAIREADSSWSVNDVLDRLDDGAQVETTGLPLITDWLDRERDTVHQVSWKSFVTHQVSQHCAAFFDDGQSNWKIDQSGGLYASWLRQVQRDYSPRLLMGLKDFRALAAALPVTVTELIETGVREMGLAPEWQESYFTGLLMSIQGWSSWCAYLRWQAELVQAEDHHILDLLAIRLAWDLLLKRTVHSETALSSWRFEWQRVDCEIQTISEAHQSLWIAQRSLEFEYQQGLAKSLRVSVQPPATAQYHAQVVFCIDVRSEVFRRSLEACSPGIATLGFAGFFGLPISFCALGSGAPLPQLPGLLAPSLKVEEIRNSAKENRAALRQLMDKSIWSKAWKAFRTLPASGFTFVETFGLAYAWRLLTQSLPKTSEGNSDREQSSDKPFFFALHTDAGPFVAADDFGPPLYDQLARIVNALGNHHRFARLVLFTGHGSQSENNPHAASLNCGACGGQTGEVNARLLAGLLNEPVTRERLAARGIAIPQTTWFLAGLHNTTTDAVTLYDSNQVPASHAEDLLVLRGDLTEAGRLSRLERSALRQPANGETDAIVLQRAAIKRAHDWSQIRPEWGLADNASFLIAPRMLTRGVDLEGRSFLHEYDAAADPDGSILEMILTGPMVVTHWINMQYYASTVDNQRFGSGDKTLHNVVGGHIGVFEGNGGDLRIGLPWQSLWDDNGLQHRPLRLTVLIAAPKENIEEILAKYSMLDDLVRNRWIHLLHWEMVTTDLSVYRAGQWEPFIVR
jgi:uncharacterized protein YbcC (UPF0753/DUF2309 family)